MALLNSAGCPLIASCRGGAQPDSSAIATTPLLRAALRRKLQHTFVGRGEDLESLYLDNFYSRFSAAEQARLVHCRRCASPYRNFLRYWHDVPDAARSRMLYADQKTYLVELLMKQDQMSMAASIESRVPFLDHPFVEFATRVPDHLKLRGADGQVHREESRRRSGAARNHLPQEDGISHADAPVAAGPPGGALIRVAAYPEWPPARLRRSHRARRSAGPHQRGVEDATDRIWRLLNLQIWGEIFLGGKDPREVSLFSPATQVA